MQTIVIGHKNPDMDSICSAVAYAHLKRATGTANVIAARAGNTNERIDFVLQKFGVEPPVFISDLDYDSSETERALMFGRFVARLAEQVDSILFALAREDGLSITDDDQSWARAIQYACSGEVRLLGFHVVTLVGSRLVPGTVAAA